jgi:hypothetical protein
MKDYVIPVRLLIIRLRRLRRNGPCLVSFLHPIASWDVCCVQSSVNKEFFSHVCEEGLKAVLVRNYSFKMEEQR